MKEDESPRRVARGAVRNAKHYSQLRDYSGLRFRRGITPTDIDGFLEFNGCVFIFIELKFQDTTLPVGQRLALERLVDCITPPKEGILIVAAHDTPSNAQIDAALCRVTEYRYRERWSIPKDTITLKRAIDKFLRRARKNGVDT